MAVQSFPSFECPEVNEEAMRGVTQSDQQRSERLPGIRAPKVLSILWLFHILCLFNILCLFHILG